MRSIIRYIVAGAMVIVALLGIPVVFPPKYSAEKESRGDKKSETLPN